MAIFSKIAKGSPVSAYALAAYSAGLSLPAARKAIGEATGIVSLTGTVDPVYFAENGRRVPIVLPATKTPAAARKALVSAVVSRRDGTDGATSDYPGGNLRRDESLASSIGAALGRKVSRAEALALYSEGGGDLATSYVGRGTRKRTPATRLDPALAVRVAPKRRKDAPTVAELVAKLDRKAAKNAKEEGDAPTA